MKEINDGWPAFPMSGFLSPMENSEALAYDNKPQFGMTMRDWFAGQALANRNIEEHSGATWADRVAEQAYRIADAMIAARNKPAE